MRLSLNPKNKKSTLILKFRIFLREEKYLVNFELYFEILLSGFPQSTFIQAGTFVLDLDSIVLVFDEKNLAKT